MSLTLETLGVAQTTTTTSKTKMVVEFTDVQIEQILVDFVKRNCPQIQSSAEAGKSVTMTVDFDASHGMLRGATVQTVTVDEFNE